MTRFRVSVKGNSEAIINCPFALNLFVKSFVRSPFIGAFLTLIYVCRPYWKRFLFYFFVHFLADFSIFVIRCVCVILISSGALIRFLCESLLWHFPIPFRLICVFVENVLPFSSNLKHIFSSKLLFLARSICTSCRVRVQDLAQQHFQFNHSCCL